MPKDFAKGFYTGSAWKQCRKAYKASRRGLCERCLAKGLYSPGVIVHHKVHLTAQNIKDPNVSLNFDNLELLCRDCHDDEHGVKDALIAANKNKQRKDFKIRRFTVDETGHVAPR